MRLAPALPAEAPEVSEEPAVLGTTIRELPALGADVDALVGMTTGGLRVTPLTLPPEDMAFAAHIGVGLKESRAARHGMLLSFIFKQRDSHCALLASVSSR